MAKMTTAAAASSKCPRCGDEHPAVRAPKAAWAIIPLAWIALIALGVVSALSLPLNLVLIPCWLACASAVGQLARGLLDPKCGACGEPRASTNPTAYVTGGSTGPAHESPMKGGLIGET